MVNLLEVGEEDSQIVYLYDCKRNCCSRVEAHSLSVKVKTSLVMDWIEVVCRMHRIHIRIRLLASNKGFLSRIRKLYLMSHTWSLLLILLNTQRGCVRCRSTCKQRCLSDDEWQFYTRTNYFWAGAFGFLWWPDSSLLFRMFTKAFQISARYERSILRMMFVARIGNP